MEHYFTNSDNLKSEIKEFKVKVQDIEFKFKTDNGVFSKGELDYGTWLLITTILKLDIKGYGLDMGCGYGAIGIILAKLKEIKMDMIDVNKRALHLTELNAKENGVLVNPYLSDGMSNVKDIYDFIVSNPPIRVGKEKLYSLFKDSKNHLKKGGVIYMVIRKEQGAKSFIKDFQNIYQIEVLEKSKGFYILKLET